MINSIGTAKRVTTSGAIQTTACHVSAITVTPRDGDIVVRLTDGSGGTVLWEIEADNASGSHSVSFSSPILFSNGCYVSVDNDRFLASVCVAVV